MEFGNIGHLALNVVNTGVLLWVAIKITRLETLWEAHKEWHKRNEE